MTNFVQFLTFAEFLDRAMKPHKDADRCASVREGESFSGVPLAKARDMAVHGWAEGFARMQTTLTSLEHSLKFPSTREIITTCLEGQTPDIGAFLRGEPECMFQVESEPTNDRKFARVHVSAGVTHETLEHQIFWRGAVAIATIHALEAAGYSVELSMDYSSRSRQDDKQATFIELKAAGQPLDVNRITFMFAHKSALRRLGFSVREHMPREVRDAIGVYNGGGYGRSFANPHPKGADVNLAFCTSSVNSQTSAAEEVRRILADLPNLLKPQTQN